MDALQLAKTVEFRDWVGWSAVADKLEEEGKGNPLFYRKLADVVRDSPFKTRTPTFYQLLDQFEKRYKRHPTSPHVYPSFLGWMKQEPDWFTDGYCLCKVTKGERGYLRRDHKGVEPARFNPELLQPLSGFMVQPTLVKVDKGTVILCLVGRRPYYINTSYAALALSRYPYGVWRESTSKKGAVCVTDVNKKELLFLCQGMFTK